MSIDALKEHKQLSTPIKPWKMPVFKRISTGVTLAIAGILSAGDSAPTTNAAQPGPDNRAVAGSEEIGKKVDITKLSAEEALEKLPDRIPLSGGKYAEVEKCSLIMSTQLAIIVQTYHDEPVKLEPRIKYYLDKSRAESAEVMMYLHKELGVKHCFIESYTYEEYVVRLLANKQNLTPKEKAMFRDAMDKLKRYRHVWSNRPFDENTEVERIDYNLREHLPPGIYDKIENGELNIVILPAETEEVSAEGMKDKFDGDVLSDPWIDFKREDTNLDLAYKNRRAFSVFMMQWPPGHWKKIRNEDRGTLPWRMYKWNMEGKGGGFCAAYVRTPAVREMERLRKEGKIDLTYREPPQRQ